MWAITGRQRLVIKRLWHISKLFDRLLLYVRKAKFSVRLIAYEYSLPKHNHSSLKVAH